MSQLFMIIGFKKSQRILIQKPISHRLYLFSFWYFSVFRIPDYLTAVIKYCSENQLYYLSPTAIASTSWYFWYQMKGTTNFYFIFVLNVLNIAQYHVMMKKKMNIVKTNLEKIKKSEAKFSRMIIIGTTVTTFGILNNLITYVLIKIFFINKIIYSSISNVFMSLSYVLLMIVFLIDIYISVSLLIQFQKF